MKFFTILFAALVTAGAASAGTMNEIERTNLPVCNSTSMDGTRISLGGSYFYVTTPTVKARFDGAGCSADIVELPAGVGVCDFKGILATPEVDARMDGDATEIIYAVVGDGYYNVDPDYDPSQPIVAGVNSPNAVDDGVPGVVTYNTNSAPFSDGNIINC